MKKIFVVDVKANKVCLDLQSASANEILMDYKPISSIPEMFNRFESELPDGILLHHNWENFQMSEVLPRMALKAPDSFLVVYTGRELKLQEMIECVRGGVADYLLIGSQDLRKFTERLIYYANNKSYSLGKLKMGTSAVRNTIEAAEAMGQKYDALLEKNESLEAALRLERSKYANQIRVVVFQILKFIAYVACVLAGVVIGRSYVSTNPWVLVGIASALVVMALLLDGGIRRITISANKRSAKGEVVAK